MAEAVVDLPTEDLVVAAAVIRRMTGAIVASREAARGERSTGARAPEAR
ncbi:hypothetical protein ACFQZ4_50375 [Catellatospora coxensis]